LIHSILTARGGGVVCLSRSLRESLDSIGMMVRGCLLVLLGLNALAVMPCGFFGFIEMQMVRSL